MIEKFKKIAGYETYQISNLGRVKNQYGKFIRTFERGGYPSAKLSKNGISKHFLIHRLVAAAFLPNPSNRQTVNHIDLNKHNNRVDNLEWATQKENIAHAWASGVCKPSFGSLKNSAKLTEKDIQPIRELLNSGYTQREVAKIYGVAHTVIGDIKRGTTWRHVKSEL